ncbi:winged helix-turn-helix transcriptional regulator [Peptoniphilus asaccharolyticus]
MTMLEKLIEYVDNNPFATNDELANELNTSNQLIRTYLNRLKNREVLKIQEIDGKREIAVLELPEIKPVEFKRGVFEMMVDCYLRDFKDAELFQDRVEIGKMIVRILEKL